MNQALSFLVAAILSLAVSFLAVLAATALGLDLSPLAAAAVAAILAAGCCALAAWRVGARDISAVRAAVDGAAHGRSPHTGGTPSLEAKNLIQAVAAIGLEIKKHKGLAKGILDGLPMPYLMVDADERCLATNKECLRMLEIESGPETQFGKTLAEIFYNDPTRKTAVGRSIREGAVFRDLEVAITGHKGGTRHVLANVFPLRDLDGTCIGGLCLYLDMTVLKDKEAHIQSQNDTMLSVVDRLRTVVDNIHSASTAIASRIEQSAEGRVSSRNASARPSRPWGT